MTERDFQRQVMDAARRLGWRVFHAHDSRRQVRPGVLVGDRDAAGFPDLLLVHPRARRVLYRELKVGRNTLSRAQAEWLTTLTDAGEDACVWRPQDWPEIEAELKMIRLVAPLDLDGAA